MLLYILPKALLFQEQGNLPCATIFVAEMLMTTMKRRLHRPKYPNSKYNHQLSCKDADVVNIKCRCCSTKVELPRKDSDSVLVPRIRHARKFLLQTFLERRTMKQRFSSIDVKVLPGNSVQKLYYHTHESPGDHPGTGLGAGQPASLQHLRPIISMSQSSGRPL